MKRKLSCLILAIALILLSGCGGKELSKTTSEAEAYTSKTEANTVGTTAETTMEEATAEETTIPNFPVSKICPDNTIQKIKKGFMYSSYTGDYGLDTFLKEGGAKSEDDLIGFLAECLVMGKVKLSFTIPGIGCSTLSVKNEKGEKYFGRNFDWDYCNTLIMVTNPKKGYKSISTVNTSFLTGNGIELTDDMIRFCAIYAPLDGMNEKGLCVSVNMINDSSKISQNTDKADLTTSTAVRVLLDKAATVDEAVNLLKKYDLHGSYGYNIHFALSDRSGKSVAVEYINNKLTVTETPVLTNFYVTEGEKYGIGSKESVARYDTLINLLNENPDMDMDNVRNALKSVSKTNNEFKTTVWSVIFDQNSLTATYFCGGDFSKGYTVKL